MYFKQIHACEQQNIPYKEYLNIEMGLSDIFNATVNSEFLQA